MSQLPQPRPGVAPLPTPPPVTPPSQVNMDVMRWAVHNHDRIERIEPLVRAIGERGQKTEENINYLANYIAELKQQLNELNQQIATHTQQVNKAITGIQADIDAVAPIEAPPPPRRKRTQRPVVQEPQEEGMEEIELPPSEIELPPAQRSQANQALAQEFVNGSSKEPPVDGTALRELRTRKPQK